MKKRLTYHDIYKSNIALMTEILRTYGTGSEAWTEFYKHYIDPDGYPLDESYKINKRVKCIADGLLSVKRIYEHEGFGEAFIESYTKYRRTPVIFFPSEKNGINMSRYRVFGDRIDHTLFDLKNRMSQDPIKRAECRLQNAYNMPKTKLWLEKEMITFENYIDWMGVKGIFTNENYDVFDLEINDGTMLTDYAREYSKTWSEQYYTNVKKKIEEFDKRYY